MTTMQPPSTPASDPDALLIAALRAGDERVVGELVGRYQRSLLRLAMTYVASAAVAEEVVQDTWIAVLTGIDRFEGRSTLRTWIFRILTNQAKTRGVRERRSVPLSTLVADEASAEDAAVAPERFRPATDARWPGHWADRPGSWTSVAEQTVLEREARGIV
jgi:RNA polymerase sigma-70 factor (ECF subfamily)